MMRILFILGFIAITHIGYSQEPERVAITTRETISGKVYNKQTGEKLPDEKVVEIIIKYPQINFEKVIGANGKVVKYYYDPGSISPDGMVEGKIEKNKTREGEPFPDFIFKTISDKTIDSKDLESSWILIRFEVFTRFAKKEDILKLNDQLNDPTLKNDITAVICFSDTHQNVEKFLQDEDLNFELVADGRNFHERYHIKNFPCTVLVNDEGILVKYFYNYDQIALRDWIQK